jgi:hypothetical protein
MGAKLDPTAVQAQYMAYAAVHGADPVRVTGYPHKGKLIVPTRVKAEWARLDLRTDWKLLELKVTGPILRKDGTPGEITGKAKWEPAVGALRFAPPVAEAPEWARTWLESVVLPLLPESTTEKET